jgi:uroporphyrinogen-III decarboxylase
MQHIEISDRAYAILKAWAERHETTVYQIVDRCVDYCALVASEHSTQG